MSRPIMSTLDNKNASTFKSADDIVLIANLIEGKDGGLEERIMQVAKQYHDRYSFGIYRRKKGHGVSLDCINNANFEQSSITDLSDPLAIDNLIRQCAAPLIPAFTRRNEGDFAKVSLGPICTFALTHNPSPLPESSRQATILLNCRIFFRKLTFMLPSFFLSPPLQTGKSMVHYLTSSDEDRESYISAMRALAKKYKEFLIFVTTDVSEYPDLLTMTGHRAGSESVLSVIKPNNAGSVFPYRGEHITPETVEAFLTEISSGKVKPWDGTWPEEEEEAGKSEQDSKRDEL